MSDEIDVQDPKRFWDMKRDAGVKDIASLGGLPWEVLDPETIRAIDNTTLMFEGKRGQLVRDILLELEAEMVSEWGESMGADKFAEYAIVIENVISVRWWHKSPWTLEFEKNEEEES